MSKACRHTSIVPRPIAQTGHTCRGHHGAGVLRPRPPHPPPFRPVWKQQPKQAETALFQRSREAKVSNQEAQNKQSWLPPQHRLLSPLRSCLFLICTKPVGEEGQRLKMKPDSCWEAHNLSSRPSQGRPHVVMVSPASWESAGGS